MSETFESWLASEIARAKDALMHAQAIRYERGEDWARGNQSALNAVKSAYNALKTTSDETRVDL